MEEQRFDAAYFDAGIDRIGTRCEKWDGMIAADGNPDMIPMWVADMDFPSPPAVRQALERVAAQGTWGYTISDAEDAKPLCAYWARRHGVHIAPEETIMSPGVVAGLKLCVRALTKPGDGVLINTPVYGPFYASIRENGRTVVESPLAQDAQGVWRMNPADIEAKLASGEAKAVMLCSPHNPCGRAWSRAELEQVAALCARYDVPLIVDEIHADFVFAPLAHCSILGVPGGERAVMLCAASKTFNVAGLQQSTIVCRDPQVRKAICREMHASGVECGNVFALAGTRAAYTDCDAWLDGLKAYLAENRDFACAYIAEHMPGIGVTPLQATYLMWLDCRSLGLSQEALLGRIREAGVRVNDGLFFGERGRGFIRLNIACPRAQLAAALGRMAKALN